MTDRTVIVDLRPGQVLKIGGATLVLREKSGQRARLVVQAPASVAIEPPERKESLQPRGAPAN